MFMLAANGGIAYANPACLQLLGQVPADLDRLRFDDLTDSATAAELRSRGGQPGIDCLFQRKDGTQFWVHALVSTCATADNDLLIVQLIDIDQRKRAEAALSLNESRLTIALQAATQGVWDHDIPTDTTFYSPSWRNMRGIPLHEPIDGSYEGWRSRIHPDDREAVIPMAQKRDAGERGFRVAEYRERHRDGRWIWIQNRGRTVGWDESGKATRTLGTDTDITDRKLADAQHQRLSRRLELALNASKTGVWEQDLVTKEIVWDHGMREIYGGDLGGKLQDSGWENAIHPDDRAGALADFEIAAHDTGLYFSQFRIILPNGEIRHVKSKAEVFEYPGSSPRIIGAEWDVTAEVRLRDELLEAKALAESRYADLKRAQADLEHAALHDYLTELPNRRFLQQTMAKRRALGKKRSQGQAALHLDLDHFKEINDTLGHGAGDAMLRHVADVLRACVRTGDFIARIGGDEFIILCASEGGTEDLTAMADRILRALGQPVSYEGHSMQVGASIGIAYERGGGVVTRRLLREADVAMYRAKTGGRNRYELSVH
jgi:diguanylate cyclase (GGDEF)-like protein/PAS domain S-box-containing protein